MGRDHSPYRSVPMSQALVRIFGIKRQHLLGAVWFDQGQGGGPSGQDWRLEGNRALLAAFNQAVGDYLW